MLRILDRYRDELGVTVSREEMLLEAEITERALREESSGIAILGAEIIADALVIDLAIENRAGHKLPTAYPSRRVWLNVVVKDRDGVTVFESGAMRDNGSIVGNDNDRDESAFEPHYTEIVEEDQVQIYETIIFDYRGETTTGLLSSAGYAKDNRLLPEGFDKYGVDDAVAVNGLAMEDEDFEAGRDQVRYRVALDEAVDLVNVEVRLMYQPIAYRWNENLRAYGAMETDRFVRYYEANAEISASLLARAETSLERDRDRHE